MHGQQRGQPSAAHVTLEHQAQRKSSGNHPKHGHSRAQSCTRRTRRETRHVKKEVPFRFSIRGRTRSRSETGTFPLPARFSNRLHLACWGFLLLALSLILAFAAFGTNPIPGGQLFYDLCIVRIR